MLIYQTGRSWIVGSIHVLTERLSEAIEPILARLIEVADIVVLESRPPDLDLESALPSAEPPGARLSNTSLLALAGQELYEKLGKRVNAAELDPQDFEDCAPWWAALRLGTHRFAEAGFNPALGVEATLKHLLEAAGKKPLSLEGPLDGLRCFAQAPLEEQLEGLRAAVEDEERFTAELDLLIQGWSTSSTQILTQLLDSRLSYLPSTYGCLMTTRNHEWVPQLDRLFRLSECSLVVVGALHLVGDSGVIALLEQRGHHFKKIAVG